MTSINRLIFSVLIVRIQINLHTFNKNINFIILSAPSNNLRQHLSKPSYAESICRSEFKTVTISALGNVMRRASLIPAFVRIV